MELFEKAAHYAHEIMTLATSTPDKLPNYIASLKWGRGSSHEKKGSKQKPTSEEEITRRHTKYPHVAPKVKTTKRK